MLLLSASDVPVTTESTSVPAWLWAAFAGLVITVLILDLGVFHRKSHKVRTREAAVWVCVWVSLAFVFGVGVFLVLGTQSGLEFLTGYIVEFSLSVDNIFVFVLIFSFFGVKPEYQHRVLFWGILGAVVMRLLFIFAAVELIEKFEVVIYIFGAFLLYTGFRFLRHEPEVHPEKNIVLRVAKRFLPVTHEYHGQKFFARETIPGSTARGRLMATPLLLVLLVVEATDVIFAVDSVPAILGITRDRFIAYTSNIFAILGLRSLYFLLASILEKFHLLRYGLSLVLMFIGAKMLLHSWVPISAEVSLVVVIATLGGSVVLSLLTPPKAPPPAPPGKDEAPPGVVEV